MCGLRNSSEREIPVQTTPVQLSTCPQRSRNSAVGITDLDGPGSSHGKGEFSLLHSVHRGTY
jgi:hypothetical protein